MNKEKIEEIFNDELTIIKDINLKEIAISFLEQVPEYFWHVPASSTGKYHPYFDQGEGGLVRHTKMCVEVAKELFRLKDYYLKDIEKDCIVISLILHDAYKNGYTDLGRTVSSHQSIAADEFYYFVHKNFNGFFENETDEKYDYYLNCIPEYISGHMGQWSRTPARSDEGKIVSMCDYIASRKFFDKYKDLKINNN